jgi:hypothetical protein
MKGGHGDNYYLQMIGNIRRYKGVPELPKASAPKNIVIDGGFEQWADVTPAFTGHRGNTIPRDFDGFGNVHYTNTTGRNNFVTMKVARDNRNLYFYAQTEHPLTPVAGPHWMTLLIRTGNSINKNWNGFDFVVNRIAGPNGKTAILEKCKGGWAWGNPIPISCATSGNQIHFAVPRAALGLNKTAVTVDFKWFDNIADPSDFLNFYVEGDTAPIGRFRFRYLTQ